VAGTAQSFAPAGVPVVGHGLGALVAIAANAKAPGQLGRLVLVDTLPGTLAALGNPWPVNSPDFADQLEARDWLAARTGGGGDAGAEAGRIARLETIEGADGRWTWRHHLASLPDGTPTVLDDDTLWAQLAATEGSLLIRTEGGPLDDKAVARFTADVPGGETATTEPGPAALAALLNTLSA
jgi:pimeloyl-ACP methyl ester carboxylesterase